MLVFDDLKWTKKSVQTLIQKNCRCSLISLSINRQSPIKLNLCKSSICIAKSPNVLLVQHFIDEDQYSVTVLYCTTLCCTVLHCTVLCCTMLCYTVLCYAVLYCLAASYWSSIREIGERTMYYIYCSLIEIHFEPISLKQTFL